MFKRIACLILAGILTASADSTDVSLSGTVKDSDGALVAGAIVVLSKVPTIKDTTDANGAFFLKGYIPTGIYTPYAITLKEISSISGSGKFVQFTTGIRSSAASISIYSTSGRKIAFLPLGQLNAGRHNVKLPDLAPGLFLLNISIENTAAISRLINTSTGFCINGMETGVNANGAPISAAAAIDQIVVTKTGYTAVSYDLDSYVKSNITIVLQKGSPVCPNLKLPAASAITYSNAKTPDPFTFKFMDLPEVTTKAQWECRRQEIYQMSQEYLYGHLPPKPDSVWGSVSGGKINVNCKVGSKTANFSISPSGSGDILVIDFGMGAPAPSNSRKCSMSASSYVKTIQTLYGSTDVGQCMAGAWAVGRVIDVLEKNPDGGISASKVITTGCSTNGKDALIAGVFEPRVALCMPVESGCAGACSWRVSSAYGHGNSNTDCQDITHLETEWLGTVASSWRKGNPKIDKLPMDQGELMALRAPYPMLVFDNGKEQYKWLCNRGATAAAQACHWIYKALGVSENFGFYQANAGHNHCTPWPSEANAALNAFYDKFLNGKTNTNTDIMNINSGSLETSKWFEFGTGKDQWDTTLVLK